MLGVAIFYPTPAFAFDKSSIKEAIPIIKECATTSKNLVLEKTNAIHQKFKEKIEQENDIQEENVKQTQTKPKNDIPISENNALHKVIKKVFKAFLLALGLFLIFAAILSKTKKKKPQTPSQESVNILNELAQSAKEETAKKNDEQIKTIIFNFFDMNK